MHQCLWPLEHQAKDRSSASQDEILPHCWETRNFQGDWKRTWQLTSSLSQERAPEEEAPCSQRGIAQGGSRDAISLRAPAHGKATGVNVTRRLTKRNHSLLKSHSRSSCEPQKSAYLRTNNNHSSSSFIQAEGWSLPKSTDVSLCHWALAFHHLFQTAAFKHLERFNLFWHLADKHMTPATKQYSSH